ncbi:hypothetical protein PHAVU_005G038300 [Phaseolus vulgaris]|uniref:Uncharacterized protein n=1 Tax=Phaseolus vulgaris TaxID=3885 RepID=V7BST1_PHAVU|nr:hypothetical protein PHAVU_005G038300g [Phaseolus vulgaris]ESW21062.1 hypothetical protein PHAVU_005G038300g [Phaseolus vulgaris]
MNLLSAIFCCCFRSKEEKNPVVAVEASSLSLKPKDSSSAPIVVSHFPVNPRHSIL